MLAKIIAHAEDRERAVRKLVYALKTLRIRGVKTNRDYLVQQLDPQSPQIPAPQEFQGLPYRYRNNPYTPRAAALTSAKTAGPISGAARSPMPGQVLRIAVAPGQFVRQGDPLVVLEAMKMEQTVRTTINGVVKSVLVQLGQVVAPGQTLVEISSEEQVP